MMPAQIVGSYTWMAEYDDEYFVEMHSNADTDMEAIAAAGATVYDGDAPRIHVRRQGRYLAEVRRGWQDRVIVEHHREDGTVYTFELPCNMRLISFWLERIVR